VNPELRLRVRASGLAALRTGIYHKGGEVVPALIY
jgi:hypothetical protein